jgi:hypothetical protein
MSPLLILLEGFLSALPGLWALIKQWFPSVPTPPTPPVPPAADAPVPATQADQVAAIDAEFAPAFAKAKGLRPAHVLGRLLLHHARRLAIADGRREAFFTAADPAGIPPPTPEEAAETAALVKAAAPKPAPKPRAKKA